MATITLSGFQAHRRPLRRVRVVRFVDRVNAGRMLLSGRIGDVCAELERLAALEAGQRAAAPIR